MIAKPIVPVEVKIVGIINHIQRAKKPTMRELLADSVSLPDMIAIFLGILELMKVGKISIDESECEVNGDGIIENGENTRFVLNEESDPEKALESMQITT